MKRYLPVLALVAATAAATGYFLLPREEKVTFDPPFDPASFVGKIDHKYFAVTPGVTLRYVKKTARGTLRVETEMTGETRQVLGITMFVVRDREWVNEQLVEDTRDWYAQDKAGNVWYFGEAVDNYKDGDLADHGGSWEAGIRGARPGIMMPARPAIGQTYRQEYLEGEAEDMGTVLAVGAKVSVPQGSYEDCVKIRDWSRLEEGGDHKYFCAGLGFLALEEAKSERLELVDVTAPAKRDVSER